MLPAEFYDMHGRECKGRVEEGLRYLGHEGTPEVDVKDTREAVHEMQVEVGGITPEVDDKFKRLERRKRGKEKKRCKWARDKARLQNAEVQ